jgi:hypothetical protein
MWEETMTTLMQQALERIAMLTADDQDELAIELLDELTFDAKLEATAHKLVHLAEAAIAEHRAGKTMPCKTV